MLRRGIHKISEERKVKVSIPICQICNLEFVNQLVDRSNIIEDCGHDYHCFRIRRNAFRQIDRRQQARLESVRHNPVQKAECQLACRNQRKQQRENGHHAERSRVNERAGDGGQNQRDEKNEGPQIAGCGVTFNGAEKSLPQSGTI